MRKEREKKPIIDPLLEKLNEENGKGGPAVYEHCFDGKTMEGASEKLKENLRYLGILYKDTSATESTTKPASEKDKSTS